VKAWIVTIALLSGIFAHAQDQSSCPAPRQPLPASSCSNGDVNRNLAIRVQSLLTRHESDSGAHSPPDSVGYAMMHSKLTPELASDTIEHVQDHPYRFCDMGLEITERVKESFQHIGYFCADVEPIAAQRTGKYEYTVNIYVRPGEQYRLSELNFSGAKILSTDELKTELHMKPNSVFNIESVRRGIGNIEKSYAKKGYPYVTAIPVASVDERNRKVALEIKIQESGASQQVP
jgi:hypothetical protein